MENGPPFFCLRFGALGPRRFRMVRLPYALGVAASMVPRWCREESVESGEAGGVLDGEHERECGERTDYGAEHTASGLLVRGGWDISRGERNAVHCAAIFTAAAHPVRPRESESPGPRPR